MTIFSSKKTVNSKADKETVKGRRSFLWKIGAGASAAVASAATFGKSSAGNQGDLREKLATLEEEKKIRALHQKFESSMNKGQFEAVQNLFSEKSEVIFNDRIFKNKQGLNHLFKNHFKAGLTGKSMAPAPGFEIDPELQQENLQLAADNLSARASFPYSIQVGIPLKSDSSLAEMARLHGGGIRTWWEGGNYKVSYVRDVKGGHWLINTLEYKILSRADYREGRSYAQAMLNS